MPGLSSLRRAGLQLGLAMLAALALAATPLAARFERLIYDLGERLSHRNPSPAVVLVAIDQATVDRLGAKASDAEVQARVIDHLVAAGAAAIAYTDFDPLPAASPMLRRLHGELERIDPQVRSRVLGLEETLKAIDLREANDRQLTQRLSGATVVLPVRRSSADARSGAPEAASHSAPAVHTDLGHVELITDDDGIVRSIPAALSSGGNSFPPLAEALLRVLARERQTERSAEAPMRLRFYPGRPTPFVVESLFDVYAGQVSKETFRDKVVLIGDAARTVASPVSPATPVGMVQAYAVSNLLQAEAVVSPAWSTLLSVLLCGLASLMAIFAPGRSGRRGVVLRAAALVAALLAAQFLLLELASIWVSTTGALVMCLLSPLVALERKEERPTVAAQTPAASSAPSDRLMALAFRQEGRLDLALHHLRKCAMSEAVIDDLYQLGVEFERRRHFGKSQEVFDYIASCDPRYRDAARRTRHGTATAKVKAVRPSVTTADAAIVLGQYQLGRELGRGAMGVVYGGRELSTGRAVAIKTMALSREFEADELDTAKRRFFGEAESAGRLDHPGIVKIFACGEEQDLAYIAMELLAGKDLAGYIEHGSLLPLATVLSIVARVADALDYAHRCNVIHRDIKPGNIMYDVAMDAVKVTDFGIARITDSNRTKTGMVLGTPAFMSPEQLAGKKIDGQSDLYSLGVTLYQLACAALPFEAGSLAQLMYKICNDAPKDPTVLNPSISEEFVRLIHKALAKEKAQRFASGAAMAAALRACSKNLTAVDFAL